LQHAKVRVCFPIRPADRLVVHGADSLAGERAGGEGAYKDWGIRLGAGGAKELAGARVRPLVAPADWLVFKGAHVRTLCLAGALGGLFQGEVLLAGFSLQDALVGEGYTIVCTYGGRRFAAFLFTSYKGWGEVRPVKL